MTSIYCQIFFQVFTSFQPQIASTLSTRNFLLTLIISCVKKVRFLHLSSPVRINEHGCLLLKIYDLVWPKNRSWTGCRRCEWCCDCWASTVKCTLVAENCMWSFFIFGFATKNSCQPAISFRSSSLDYKKQNYEENSTWIFVFIFLTLILASFALRIGNK